MTGGRASRNKGIRGESEVLAMIKARGWPHAIRNFASGAAGHSDIAYGPQGVALEIKRTERLALHATWRQVSEDAGRRGDLPLIATRWNASPWLAITELDEVLALLHLREQA